MTPEEAIRRIKDHNEIHSRKEQHFAVHITEALNMAVVALENQIQQNLLSPGKPLHTAARTKLLQLIAEADENCDKTECSLCPYFKEKDCEHGLIVDYLLSKGVTVPLAVNEGNEVEQADWKTSMMQHFTKVE